MAQRTYAPGNPWTRKALLAAVLAMAFVLLVAPLAVIFVQAFSRGLDTFARAISHPDTIHAIYLSVITALIVVPINTAFGIAAAWTVTRYDFRGKRLLIMLIELPFSISPIVAGVAYLFVFGLQSWLGPWLQAADIKILFALP